MGNERIMRWLETVLSGRDYLRQWQCISPSLALRQPANWTQHLPHSMNAEVSYKKIRAQFFWLR